jgi:uncharacterized membrane protein YedE/YeeE
MDPTWLAIPIGLVFGFALSRGGLTRYTNIVGVFRLTNMTVIKFMLTALTVAMIVLYALKGLNIVQFPNVPETYIAGNILGGLVFGMGMALAGFCPGTVAAGAGEGQLDYLVSGVLGLLAGALAYGMTYLQVFPAIARIAYIGPKTLPDLLAVNPFIVIGIFSVAVILLFYFIERGLTRKDRLKEETIDEPARSANLQPE